MVARLRCHRKEEKGGGGGGRKWKGAEDRSAEVRQETR